MKNLSDVLLAGKPSEEILMGNEAVVRAMVETRTKVVTSYPGSPTPEIASAITKMAKEICPFYFEFSVNEKVATEVALGAALNGNLSCVFFKSVGLNVALDSFVQLPLLNIIGGLVVVLGDDPGANSSQNEQDNRNICKMSHVTVLEPASVQEVYDYYKLAADIARKEQTVIVLRMTTHVCHARQKIALAVLSDTPATYQTNFSRENGPYIALTVKALEMKRRSLEKLERIKGYVIEKKLNRVFKSGMKTQKGIITSGLTCLSVFDVLDDAAYKPDILKLGAVYPLDDHSIVKFLRDHDQVLVLEELDNFLELEIKSIAYDAGLTTKIIGKTEPEDFIGEYTPDKTWQKLSSVWPDLLPESEPIPDIGVHIPERPAQMCPGCGHRSAFFAIKNALRDEDVTVADIGCHTLGYMAPYRLGEILLCMGASTGIASGLSLNNSKRVVAFLGDSTFFHAGLPGLINTVFNEHDITMVLMENGTTAMTGHQEHAGDKISPAGLLKGLGIEHIFSCDTYSQAKLTKLVKESMALKGVSVVIASHPCMLKFNRMRRKKTGFIQKHVKIDQEVCNLNQTCIARFGCPSFILKKDHTVDINLDLCVGDGSCRATCPQHAIGLPKGEK